MYTDGSASRESQDLQPGAWAFFVFAHCAPGPLLLGHASGSTVPPGTPFFLGEQNEDAMTAELLAACWALSWASEWGPAYQVPIHFLYDAQSVGCGAFGASRPVGVDPRSPYHHLARLAVDLRQYVSVRAQIRHSHIRSHQGVLGNELADAQAKFARKQPESPYDRCLPTWPAKLASHRLSSWAWAMVPGQTDFPRPFSFEAEASLAQTHPQLPTQAPTEGITTCQGQAKEVHFRLVCVTFNVLTLREPKRGRDATATGLRMLGRRDVLKSSLAPHKPS